MDKQSVTIYDVAKKAGVSMATVSRVVNNNTNVNPSTRYKVLKVIDELNYQPNAVARGLASKKTTTIGVIIPDITNLYFASLSRGIEDIATMYNYNIILSTSDDNVNKEFSVFETLISKQVDGIVFMGSHLTGKVRNIIKRLQIPIVLAGAVDKEKKLVSVHINYSMAVKKAIKILLSHGNKKIAFVCGSLKYSINREHYLKGYKEALLDSMINLNPDLIFETNKDYVSGKKLWPVLCKNNVDAAFICNDELATGVLDGALDDGIEVPSEFEIISGDGTKLTKIVRPQLSSISQPLYDIGAISMRCLTKLMNKEAISTNIELKYKYIRRGSTR